MKKIFLALALCSLLLHGNSPAEAAVPKLLTYQGILKDSSGNFLTGTYSMTFRIYSAATGGSSLWSETQSSVSASSGRFSVILGSVTAINLGFTSDYWLSVQVGTDAEMAPRQRLTSSGYSLLAEDVTGGKLTGSAHAADSHMNIEGVRSAHVNIAKTNFKVDAITLASANSMGDLVIDSFNDSIGISAGSSSGYTRRGASDYDVIVTPTGGGVIQQSTTTGGLYEVISNYSPAYNGIGQRFKHNAQVTVDKVSFKWQKLGSPTGNVKIRLYSDSSGVPGTQLAETGSISVASIGATYPSWEEYTATLGTAVTLQANTDYHVVIENIDGSGDGSNHMNVQTGNGNVYSDGISVSKNSSSSWQTLGDDLYFKVYEQQQQTGTATVISTAYTESTAPTEAIVIADETLGTGSITYYVSRDNGTTWTSCTKETVTSISGQPSGTQLKWKAVINGNAELNAIAVAV